MRKTITKIPGLTVNIIIEEVHHEHATGGLICYVAAIYIQPHGRADKRLVRKSRLPGAAAALKAEIKKDGLRAFDRLLQQTRHYSKFVKCKPPPQATQIVRKSGCRA